MTFLNLQTVLEVLKPNLTQVVVTTALKVDLAFITEIVI